MANCGPISPRIYIYILIVTMLLILLQACGGESESEVKTANTGAALSVPKESPTTASKEVIKVTTAEPAKPAKKESAPTIVSPTTVVRKVESTKTEAPKVAATAIPQPTATPKTQEVVSEQKEDTAVSFGPVSSGLDPSKYVEVCKGLNLEAQKTKLKEIVEELFVGTTRHDKDFAKARNISELKRLHHPPDIRDRRRGGGILINISINGDERRTVQEKKAILDVVFRDALEAVYRAGCADLMEATISARLNAFGAQIIGPSNTTLADVFKVGLKAEQANAIDWENKENIDFNTVWKTLILHTRWRKELKLRSD